MHYYGYFPLRSYVYVYVLYIYNAKHFGYCNFTILEIILYNGLQNHYFVILNIIKIFFKEL